MRRALPTLAAGVTIGLVTVLAQLSFAALLFNGPLASRLGVGFTAALMGAVVIGVVLASLCSAVVAEMHDADPLTDPLVTVLVLIALASGMFGLLALLLGSCRAGDLFRYLPYPVLGGFIAGSGALLIRGGVALMVGAGSSIGELWATLVQPDLLGHWLPGFLLAVAMVVESRRRANWLTLPTFLIAASVVVHLLLVLNGEGIASARAAGLLPDAEPVPLSVLLGELRGSSVAWGILLRRLPDLLAVAFIAILGTLLNATAIEVTMRRELDLNRDLRVVGVANVLAGLLGSPPGFHSLSLSSLPQHMAVAGCRVGLVAAMVCLAALLGGQEIVALVPTAVTGGLLVFLGLSLLADWLLDKRPHFSTLEFAVLLAIVWLTVTAGWMMALLFGLGLALLLFTVQYSRISAIRSLLTARSRRSSVDRSPEATELLDRYGDSILVICLQGHLFFGTAYILRRSVLERLESGEDRRPRWIVLDMRLLSGLDASAIYTFQRLQQIAEEGKCDLIFSGLSKQIRAVLHRSGILHDDREGVDWYRDLDHAIEFCENELLLLHGLRPDAAIPVPFLSLEGNGPEEGPVRERLMTCFTTCSWPAGTVIIEEGAPPSDLYFLLSGRVVVERDSGSGQPLRLRTMDPGTCIGEMSFYLGNSTSASVVAEGPVTALRLSREALALLEKHDPAAALLLHRLVARRLAQRVITTNTLAEALAG